jgi:hypothetical protein
MKGARASFPGKLMLAVILSVALLLSSGISVQAKTKPNGQTVDTVLLYMTNSSNEKILVSQLPVAELESDLKKGLMDNTVYNYSLLDRFVTTVHQECQGLTLPEFLRYAQDKSEVGALKQMNLTFDGQDKVRFWEMDQNSYDDMDTYTWKELYGVKRYNFPMLYEYWNYNTQDYYDPKGVMSRDQVINHIFDNGEPSEFRLSVRTFSQRYLVASEKWSSKDFNMENYWHERGLLDNERSIRMMMPMTKDDLYHGDSTASDSRYWIWNILLEMEKKPLLPAMGKVAAPTASVTNGGDGYDYVTFSCSTAGASIYYNHNYLNTSYMPTCEYQPGSRVQIPESAFDNGKLDMTAHAVRDGFSDAGVVTLTLTADSGKGNSNITETGVWKNPFRDVKETAWYFGAVSYVSEKNIFSGTGGTSFSPDAAMTRGMFVTVLGRMAGVKTADYAGTQFSDAAAGSWYGPYVAWASENGIVSGAGNGRFLPDKEITREQMALILYNYAKYSGSDVSSVSANQKFSTFSDSIKTSEWAKNALIWTAGKEIINGTGGVIAPQAAATRAQVAQILVNFEKQGKSL